MKQIITALLLAVSLEALSQDSAGQNTPIITVPIAEISKHTGDSVSLTGKVSGGRFLANSGLTLLNIDGNYPDQKLTVVIKGASRDKFKEKPEELFKGKTVKISGKVTEFKGKPQIEIFDPKQIEIVE